MPTPAPDWRERHGADVAEALRRRDPASIRRLYADLGALLEASYANDADQVPQLSLPETVPVVTDLLGSVRGLILDAGCGPFPAASITLASADPARRLVALDLGAGTVRLARTTSTNAGVPLLVVVGDLEHLPFRDSCFAGAVCDDTIEHVPDDRTGVAELLRVVEPDGTAVIATPNRHSIEVILRQAADLARRRRHPASHYYAAESHLREYRWRELLALLPTGTTVDHRRTVGWRGGRLRRVAARVVSRRPFQGLDRMLVVAVRPPRP